MAYRRSTGVFLFLRALRGYSMKKMTREMGLGGEEVKGVLQENRNKTPTHHIHT